MINTKKKVNTEKGENECAEEKDERAVSNSTKMRTEETSTKNSAGEDIRNDNNNKDDLNEDVDNEKQEMYTVEKILNHREEGKRERKKITLLIKWVGYDVPTWELETSMRESINDDVEKYMKTVATMKKKTSMRGKPVFEKIIQCPNDHKMSGNFKQTTNSWEVDNVECQGGCGMNFAEKKCGQRNSAWICNGRIRHACKVVYCTNCFCNKLLDTAMKRRGRNPKHIEVEKDDRSKRTLRRKKIDDSLQTKKI